MEVDQEFSDHLVVGQKPVGGEIEYLSTGMDLTQ